MSINVVLFIILIALNLSKVFVESVTTASLCKDILNKSKELQLKTYLFCDYDFDVRPQTKEKNSTKVGITFMPKIVQFDDLTSNLIISTWIAMNWSDPHLTWNPDDYDGWTDLHVSSYNIWVPDITVHNSGDMSSDEMGIPKTDCTLSHDGAVMCIPAIKYESHCDADYTNFPYDVQNCSVQLASWAYSADELSFFKTHGIMMSDFTPSTEWQVLSISATSELQKFKLNETYSSYVFNIQVIIQRVGVGMNAIYIAPALVLMVMTLSVLWLDCQSTERMVVACISFVCHFICIQNLFWRIPHNGEVVPGILRFYEKSFLVMAICLILTVLLRELYTTKSSAPRWIASTTSLVLQSKVGQLLLLSILDPKASAFLESSADDNTDLVNPLKKDSTWNYVSLLIGWFAFIAVFISYVIMLALYLPTATYRHTGV